MFSRLIGSGWTGCGHAGSAFHDDRSLELTRDGAGGSYVQIGGKLGSTRYDGPAPWEPQQQNDMRPRVVDRAKVKAARKIARVNRRKRGKH
jgi:hypothetical protein